MRIKKANAVYLYKGLFAHNAVFTKRYYSSNNQSDFSHEPLTNDSQDFSTSEKEAVSSETLCQSFKTISVKIEKQADNLKNVGKEFGAIGNSFDAVGDCFVQLAKNLDEVGENFGQVQGTIAEIHKKINHLNNGREKINENLNELKKTQLDIEIKYEELKEKHEKFQNNLNIKYTQLENKYNDLHRHVIAIAAFIVLSVIFLTYYRNRIFLSILEALGLGPKVLNELIEQTIEKIDAKVKQRINQVDTTVEQRIDQANAKVKERIDQIDEKVGEKVKLIDNELAEKTRQAEKLLHELNQQPKNDIKELSKFKEKQMLINKLNVEIIRLEKKSSQSLSSSWFLSWLSQGYAHQLKIESLKKLLPELVDNNISESTRQSVKDVYTNSSCEPEDAQFRDELLFPKLGLK